MKELQILSAETQMVTIPLDKPFNLGFGTLDNLPRVFFKISAQDETGKMLDSIGEASIDFPFSNYDAWDIHYTLENLKLTGLKIKDRELFLTEIVDKNPFLAEFPASNAALNMAFDDLFGKSLNVPTQELYDTTFRDCGRALSSIPFLENNNLVKEISQKNKNGMIPKPKVGRDLENDLQTIASVDNIATENQTHYVLDFNGAYDPETFSLLLKKLKQKGVTFQHLLFLEQPTKKNDGINSLCEAKTLASSIFNKDIVVIADESFVTENDAKTCIYGDIGLNIKIQKIGGGIIAKKIDDLAIDKVVSIVGGTFPTVVARVYDQQIACILRSATLPGDGWEPSTHWFYQERHFANHHFETKPDGRFIANKKPGLGLNIDWEKLNKFKVENPRDEFRKVRSDKHSDKVKITLKNQTSYKSLYESLSKKDHDWNLN